MVRAPDGMTPSTACSTAERWTWAVTMANGALTTAEPISQAMSRTESTLTAAPATESIRVAGRQCTRERTAAPIAGGEQLADHGGHEHGDDRHQSLLGRPLHQGPGERGRKRGTHRRSAQEPGEAQNSDDEALAVTGYGKRCGERNQDQVKQVTRHQPTV